MKCFQKANDEINLKKAKAYYMADNSSRTIIEVNTEINFIKDKLYNYKEMGKV